MFIKDSVQELNHNHFLLLLLLVVVMIMNGSYWKSTTLWFVDPDETKSMERKDFSVSFFLFFIYLQTLLGSLNYSRVRRGLWL